MAPLEVWTERQSYAPGEVVKGVVSVTLGHASRTLEVTLDFCEQSTSYTSVARRVSSGPIWQGELQPGQQFYFGLPLPPDAEPAYRSRHGALWWQVDARSDKFGRDPHGVRRIDVFPPDIGGIVFPAVACFVAGQTLGARKPPPPPGWYPDPSRHARERWWDGIQWTSAAR